MVGPEGMLSEGHLEVGEWKDSKGKQYVSISRNGGYRKTIAIPVDLVPALMEVMTAKVQEIEGRPA